MSRALINESSLTAIANAIRGKNGSSDTYTPGQMAAAIDAIPTGGITPTGTVVITENGIHNVTQYADADVQVQPNLQSKTVTQNGTITPDQGYDGLSQVVVNVSGGGGAQYDYLNEYNAAWGYTGDNANSSIYYPDRIMVSAASGGTGTWCTTTPIDFTGKTRIRIKISALVGSYTTMCRLAISARPISNTDRGDVWVVFDNGVGEYVVNLPTQKTAIYVGAMAWTQSFFVVDQITAE